MIQIQKHPIIKGAFILTMTGFITRFIGFFYRIFLSRTFGEESVGLYQLIFPIYALGFSLTAAGIETAISRCVASKVSLGKASHAKEILYTGISISIALSCLATFFLQRHSAFIAEQFLNEPRCESLLVILSYAFPFASIHSCICGYYFGLKQTKIPAISQLIEQITRVLSMYILYLFFIKHSLNAGIIIAVIGLTIGEIASSFFCIQVINSKKSGTISIPSFLSGYTCHMKELLLLSVPLTCNRVLLNILQSIESVSIPLQLQTFGFSTSESLSTYGVLTGMALPCVLFPSAITNAVATMLLPTIAEIQALNNRKEMTSVVKKVSVLCFSLGCFCCIFLLLFGRLAGNILFHSRLAGEFIITLAWICPFLYTNSNFISIINGLGYTMISFLFNTLGLIIRIGSVFFLIPFLGIRGYLWGLLGSQLFTFLCCLTFLTHYLSKK